MSTYGIDAIAVYIPKLYLDIADLAEAREIPYEKLRKGLGLEQMALPDTDEDAASFAANALWKLIDDNNLDPREIGRIYVGTESAVDGSKPTATYATEYVEQRLAPQYGNRCFKNCDVVDLTFACVGAVDAMQNCLDWVKGGQNRKAIVIASDLSKYELHSTGEYTQGAGAVAVLITADPKIVCLGDTWGIGMQSVGDFFKPRRSFVKEDLLKELTDSAAISLPNSEQTGSLWSDPHRIVNVYREEPVFDGQYSNACYSDRITEALAHYKEQKSTANFMNWDYLVFHLPYAYHGRRIILRNWLDWIKDTPKYEALIAEVGNPDEDQKGWKRTVAKSSLYTKFVSDHIEITERASSVIGNMYTASIFMALVSLLMHAQEDGIDLTGKSLGFIAYGSGSKSKVFQGEVLPSWKAGIANMDLKKQLQARKQVDIKTYQQLHTGAQQQPLVVSDDIVLTHIESEKETAIGLRTYAQNKA